MHEGTTQSDKRYSRGQIVLAIVIILFGALITSGFWRSYKEANDWELTGADGERLRRASSVSQGLVDFMIPARGALDNYYARHKTLPTGTPEEISAQLHLPPPSQMHNAIVNTLIILENGIIRMQFTETGEVGKVVLMTPRMSENGQHLLWTCSSPKDKGVSDLRLLPKMCQSR